MIARINARLKARMGTRLVLGYSLLTLLSMVAILATIGTMMRGRMFSTADIGLDHNAHTVQAVLENEESLLSDQAVAVANVQALSEGLAANDYARVQRYVFAFHDSLALDAMYVIDQENRVIAQVVGSTGDGASLPGLPLVQRALGGSVVSGPCQIAGSLWLVAVAPHYSADGTADAMVLLAKRLGRRYLQDLRDTLGLQIVLAMGDTVESSFDPLPPEIAKNPVDGSAAAVLPYKDGQVDHSNMRIGNLPYRVAAFTFPMGDGTHLTAYLFYMSASFEESMWIAIAQVVGVSLLIMVAGSVGVFVFARDASRPLRELAQAARAIAGGDLSRPLKVKTQDEIGQVAASFEEMRERVRAMLDAQRRWNAELEEKVRQKTAEMQALGKARDQLLQEMITAQEAERKRIARELHDETSQTLTAMIANLAVAQRLPAEQLAGHVSELRDTVVDLLSEVNRIVLDLRPTLLDDYGLVSALSWYAKNRLEPSGTVVAISTTGRETRLSPILETILFRVGQEAITNIAKHAQASEVAINIAFDGHHGGRTLALRIVDNGCGFDVKTAGHFWAGDRPRLGVLGMHERVALIDGQLEIISTPGKGTCVSVTVPVEAELQEGGQSNEYDQGSSRGRSRDSTRRGTRLTGRLSRS